jgi:hypothetical protein
VAQRLGLRAGGVDQCRLPDVGAALDQHDAPAAGYPPRHGRRFLALDQKRHSSP